MTGRQHIFAGTCVSAGMVLGGHPIDAAVAGVLLGSLFPDIDSRTSTLGLLFPSASGAARTISGHRGFTHSIAFEVIIAAIAAYYRDSFLYGLFFGTLFHVLLDCFTGSGIRFFFPSKRKLKIFGVKSGKFLSWLITWSLAMLGFAAAFVFFGEMSGSPVYAAAKEVVKKLPDLPACARETWQIIEHCINKMLC